MLYGLLVFAIGCFAYVIWREYHSGAAAERLEKTLKETVVEVFGIESLALLDEAVKNVQDKLDRIRNVADYEAEVEKLKQQASDLRITNDERAAEWARKETEIEFKVGLDRRRHEQELELSKRDAILTVREENLSKDIERFKEQAQAERDAVRGEMESLRKLTGELLERLPDARMIAKIGQ